MQPTGGPSHFDEVSPALLDFSLRQFSTTYALFCALLVGPNTPYPLCFQSAPHSFVHNRGVPLPPHLHRDRRSSGPFRLQASTFDFFPHRSPVTISSVTCPSASLVAGRCPRATNLFSFRTYKNGAQPTDHQSPITSHCSPATGHWPQSLPHPCILCFTSMSFQDSGMGTPGDPNVPKAKGAPVTPGAPRGGDAAS